MKKKGKNYNKMLMMEYILFLGAPRKLHFLSDLFYCKFCTSSNISYLAKKGLSKKKRPIENLNKFL
jgi:hypothetical protein